MCAPLPPLVDAQIKHEAAPALAAVDEGVLETDADGAAHGTAASGAVLGGRYLLDTCKLYALIRVW